MVVPLLDLHAQYAPIRSQMLEALTRVCDSQQFILGTEVESLEAEMAATLGVKNAIGVSSGTDALLVSMMALGIGPGDEVITSTYSFFATAGSIARLGATPVLVDIDPQTYNIDPSQVEAVANRRTKAIMPVHLFGLVADCGRLTELAETPGRPSDRGCVSGDRRTLSWASRGRIRRRRVFFFFPSKNLGGAGDGGLVTTNDDEIAERIRLLRRHGAEKQYVHRVIGGNFRLDALQASVLRVKLPYLRQWTDDRRRNALRYRSLFQEFGLSDIIAPPVEPDNYFHVYNQYVIRAPRREALRKHLQEQGIGTAVYYPVPFHAQECFRHLNYAPGAFPNAEAASRETLALPVYPELTLEQQTYVVQSIADFYR